MASLSEFISVTWRHLYVRHVYVLGVTSGPRQCDWNKESFSNFICHVSETLSRAPDGMTSVKNNQVWITFIARIRGYQARRNRTSQKPQFKICNTTSVENRMSDGRRFGFGFIILMYLLPAIGLSPSGSSTVHIYTQNNTMKQNTQNGTYMTIRIHIHNNKNLMFIGPCIILIVE